MRRLLMGLCVGLFLMTVAVPRGRAAEGDAAAELALKPDPLVGDYEGTFSRQGRENVKAQGNVIAEGDDLYRVLLWAPASESGARPSLIELPGRRAGDELALKGRSLGVDWKGALKGETLTAATGDSYPVEFALKKIERPSPTEGAKPPAGAIVLLPFTEGKAPDMSEWNATDWKALPDGSMQVAQTDNTTKREFQDFQLHLEFRLPLEPKERGQGRANSGIYIFERYECQILDSFGLLPHSGDCGALYKTYAPLVNACRPPERWQTYDITFRAPRLDASGKLTEPADVTMKLNGILVQDHAKVSEPTGAAKPKGNLARGRIKLQNHKHPVQYRNIWLVETK